MQLAEGFLTLPPSSPHLTFLQWEVTWLEHQQLFHHSEGHLTITSDLPHAAHHCFENGCYKQNNKFGVQLTHCPALAELL